MILDSEIVLQVRQGADLAWSLFTCMQRLSLTWYPRPCIVENNPSILNAHLEIGHVLKL